MGGKLMENFVELFRTQAQPHVGGYAIAMSESGVGMGFVRRNEPGRFVNIVQLLEPIAEIIRLDFVLEMNGVLTPLLAEVLEGLESELGQNAGLPMISSRRRGRRTWNSDRQLRNLFAELRAAVATIRMEYCQRTYDQFLEEIVRAYQN